MRQGILPARISDQGLRAIAAIVTTLVAILAMGFSWTASMMTAEDRGVDSYKGQILISDKFDESIVRIDVHGISVWQTLGEAEAVRPASYVVGEPGTEAKPMFASYVEPSQGSEFSAYRSAISIGPGRFGDSTDPAYGRADYTFLGRATKNGENSKRFERIDKTAEMSGSDHPDASLRPTL